MSWGRIDDGFHDHPKVEELSLAAVGLWTLCLSRALRHRKTDAVPGFVPEARVRKIAGAQTKRLTAELVTPPAGRKFGLWEPIEGGWLIHDFSDYLPRGRDPDEAAASGRKGAAAKWAKQGKSIANSQPDSQPPSQELASPEASSDLANGMAPDGPRASAPAFPSRPVPSRTTEDQDLGGDRNETLPPASATKPPPNDEHCSRHPTGNPTGEPCRGCQRVEERKTRRGDRAAEQAARAAERAALACTRCDGTWVIDEDTKLPTRRKCDHQPARSSA